MALEIKDPTKLPREIIVFYSWQSHTDKKLNLRLIEDALEAAIAKVQVKLDPEWKCTIKLDRDTRERAGSVEIANTILEKIRKATMVVADVTAVLSSNDGKEHYPNPNVMLELGYAARSLGWNRVVGVCNETNCGIKQLPFDIQHRRLTPYRCACKAEAESAERDLTAKLVVAITAILVSIGNDEADPSLGESELRRRRDLVLLKEVLMTVNVPVMDTYIDQLWSGMYYKPIKWYWVKFKSLMLRTTSHFLAPDLEAKVQDLYTNWDTLNGLTGLMFYPSDKHDGYVMKDDVYWDKLDFERRDRMYEVLEKVEKAFRSFIDHVKHHYMEFDIHETSEGARVHIETLYGPQEEF
jgi:hypothetical protein